MAGSRAAALAAALQAAAGATWGYSGATGPENWWDATIGGSLECTGMRQSPTNLDSESMVDGGAGFLRLWAPLDVVGEMRYLENTGHGVALNVRDRGVVMTSSSFPSNMLLHDVHFHTKSEHLLDGKQYVLEMHLVFVPADTEHVSHLTPAAREPYVVLAILFELESQGSPASPLADFILDKIPLIESAENGRTPVAWDTRLNRDFRTLSGIGNASVWLDGLDKDQYAEYEGSLTTPPCTETVQWLVNLRPRRIRESLLRRFEGMLNSREGNSRPVQPLNGRRVTRRTFSGPVHAAHESEFAELKVSLSNYRSVQPTTGNTVTVNANNVDDATTKGYLVAVVLLSVAVVLTVVGIFVTITVRKPEPADAAEDQGSVQDYEEDVEEGEGEEDEEREEEEEEPPHEPTEEELLEEELRRLGIPSEADLLDPANYPFAEKKDPTQDATGREAYRAKAGELSTHGDFFMFPIDSVTAQFDLHQLNLRHSGLGDKGAIALAECLKWNHSVRELSLVDNWITARGGAHLLRALKDNRGIEKLDVSENRLGYRAGNLGREDYLGDLLTALLGPDSGCKQMRSLILRANHIGDRDMQKIALALGENNWLEEIDVSYNELGVDSGKAIGKMLVDNGTLRTLNIEWNQLRGPGTLSVLGEDGMATNNTLRTLLMGWNGAEDAAGVAFGKVLEMNGSLEQVYLDHNRIGRRGAEQIANGLRANTSLKRFVLCHNPLGDLGCKAIIEAIAGTQNRMLCYVDIKNSDAGTEAQKELQNTKKARPDIEIAVPRSLMIPKESAPAEAVEEATQQQ
eukprot:TRINITY_DN47059_c0_g1_i1.p1 TRINITY_DN47059_c0_g1~~TRINITY_DN47059_c0_g1_i1.p1  ORF type:complete len:800 (+),score=290.58 TRINITY_DN47059_c0_g1_i1:58-2457(+)